MNAEIKPTIETDSKLASNLKPISVPAMNENSEWIMIEFEWSGIAAKEKMAAGANEWAGIN